jgi:dienelactone hydrolase
MRLPIASPALVSAVLLFTLLPGAAQQKPSEFYEENVPDSNPIRSEQARELDGYLKRLKSDDTRLREVFRPDYSSIRAFQSSTRRLRETYAASMGYPPPGKPDSEPPKFERIGEDEIGIYYRTSISVLPEVHAVGIYITPKNVKSKAPLVISMHGGGGSPEVALFRGGANYHDMVRGGVSRGYVVWAPTHLFRAEGYPQNVRAQVDDRARSLGTSITAIEIAKITRSLDVILKRPEVDPKRVAMVGLSYGGFYTLATMALEPRIGVGVSSCYYGVQEYRYEQDELSIPSDFRFMDRMSLHKDSELVALICPRPLEIQAGSRDNPTHREMGKQLAPQSGEYYRRLGKADRFRFLVFEGGHEWHDPTAWEWLKKHL